MLEMGSHVVCPALRTPAGGSQRLDCCSRLSPPVSGIMRAPSRLQSGPGQKDPAWTLWHPQHPRPGLSHQHPRGKVGGHNNQVAAALYPQPTLATVPTPMATPPTTVSLPGPSLPQHARPSVPTLRLPHCLWIQSKPLATLHSYWSSVASTPPHPHPYSGPKQLAFSPISLLPLANVPASLWKHPANPTNVTSCRKPSPMAPPRSICPKLHTPSLLLSEPLAQPHITALLGLPRAAVSRPH